MLVKLDKAQIVMGLGFIPLGGGMFTIVDPEDFEHLRHYHWFAKQSGSCWYAVRKVTGPNSVYFVRMHRQIMHTPKDQVVHHLNGWSLDNRRYNLINCTPDEHSLYH